MSSSLIDTFEEAAPRYDSSGAQFAGPVAEHLVALARPRPGERVLDVGCGAGAVATRCARAVDPGGQVTGLDLSEGIRPDPRWSPVFGAVDAFAQRAGFESYAERLGPPGEMAATLAALGYTGIEVTTRQIDVHYSGPRQWWRASWAEAPRLAWQYIPGPDRDAARRAAFTLLDRMREPDGTLVRHVQMAFATARRPGTRGPATGVSR